MNRPPNQSSHLLRGKPPTKFTNSPSPLASPQRGGSVNVVGVSQDRTASEDVSSSTPLEPIRLSRSIWDRIEASNARINRKQDPAIVQRRVESRLRRASAPPPSSADPAEPLPSTYELQLSRIEERRKRQRDPARPRRRGERGPSRTHEAGQLKRLEALAVRSAVKTAVLGEMQTLMDDIIEFFISFHDDQGAQPTIEDARREHPEVYAKFLRFMELRNFLRREGLKTKMADAQISLPGDAAPAIARKSRAAKAMDGFHGPVPEKLTLRPAISQLMQRRVELEERARQGGDREVDI